MPVSKQCPLCQQETVEFKNRVLLAMNAKQRCRECGAAWRVLVGVRVFSFFYGPGITLTVGLLCVTILGLPVVVAAVAALLAWSVARGLLPITVIEGDPLTKRAARRLRGEAPGGE
jgi:hypothetical protein